ncbi:MAG: transposase [Neisseria sp.]|nr:transposase [Neisseria sp.]
MTQQTFAELEYAHKKRKTRRKKFLERMDKLIPRKTLEHCTSKHYSQSKNERPPYLLSVMLRIHCIQFFYSLSDPLMEDSLYEIESMRRFAGLRLFDTLPTKPPFSIFAIF